MNITDLLSMPISSLRGDSLKHYASEYYDPVKAHEYYEAHKQLKGRKKGTSEDTSSDSKDTSGTPANSSKSKSSKESSYEEEYERYHFETQKKISALQRRLGRLSKEARMLIADEIYAEIDKIREENMNKKYELKAKYGKGSGSSSGNGAGRFSETTSAAYKAKWGSGS